MYKSKNYLAAETTLRDAVVLLESLRPKLSDSIKVSIFEVQADAYRLLQQVLVAQNKTDAALEIAERGRARAFVELLASRLSNNETQSRPTPPTLEQIKQIAKIENATLVEYSIVSDLLLNAGKEQVRPTEIYIWLIKPTGEVIFRKSEIKSLLQKEKKTLAELVISSRDAIGARGRGLGVSYRPDTPKVENQLRSLHQILIQPIADLLPKTASERVIFIPQDALYLVPFPALLGSNGKYLIEQHTILASPSIQVLDLTTRQREKVQQVGLKDALVVGNPTMPKVVLKIGEPEQQLPPLPGAEQEALAIASLLRTQALTGDKATKASILQRLPNALIVHLATHGILDDIQGLESAIALAPSGKDNGLLTAGEILELKLNAQLVVLSACDTGRGRITGDGVIGLSRSFISAGVPSVIVSLWAVPDAPTASLMTEFYQNLSKNPDKAVALRQAMLNTMKQHPNPRDWAAFTLIGSAE